MDVSQEEGKQSERKVHGTFLVTKSICKSSFSLNLMLKGAGVRVSEGKESKCWVFCFSFVKSSNWPHLVSKFGHSNQNQGIQAKA